MTTPRSRHAARLRAERRRAQARARLLALALVLGSLGTVTLLLTAFGGWDAAPAAERAAPPAPAPSSPPAPQALATVGNLQLSSPIAEGGVTAVGFHGARDGALALHPVGPQANEGLLARLWRRLTGAEREGLAWYRLEGEEPRTLDVGAAPGTDVYSPVTGTVVAIRDQVVSGRRIGAKVELRPALAPSLVVAVENVRPDAALSVGANVVAGSSKLGTLAPISRVERQALARYAPGGGDNVSIRVYPSASIGVP